MIRTSAIEGTNVDTLFDTVAKLLYKSTKTAKPEEQPDTEVVLQPEPEEKEKEKPKGGCCN